MLPYLMNEEIAYLTEKHGNFRWLAVISWPRPHHTYNVHQWFKQWFCLSKIGLFDLTEMLLQWIQMNTDISGFRERCFCWRVKNKMKTTNSLSIMNIILKSRLFQVKMKNVLRSIVDSHCSNCCWLLFQNENENKSVSRNNNNLASICILLACGLFLLSFVMQNVNHSLCNTTAYDLLLEAFNATIATHSTNYIW